MRKASESIQRRIEGIKRELAVLGPMQPGSISEQYNVCGTPGCRCKDPKNPRKHGPYSKLSYTWRGKVHNEFVRKEDLQERREMVREYKRFRELTNEWVDLSLEMARLGRVKK
jgi:hypothetical protein